MTLANHLSHAWRDGRRAAASAPGAVLLAGGGGALGSAVLESLLGARRHGPVRVLASRPLGVAMHGLEAVVVASIAQLHTEVGAQPIAQIGLVVFDRARHANGRELAFWRPAPDDLVPLAHWLQASGVRQLVVVMPHTAIGLPDALKRGLASLDEHAVATLGFEHVVFVRSAQLPAKARAGSWLQRVADGILAQLHIMVPASHQPVRARKVAQLVLEIAAQLPASPPGTRVAAPELVWQAAQLRDPAALVEAWLAGRELPQLVAPRMRL